MARKSKRNPRLVIVALGAVMAFSAIIVLAPIFFDSNRTKPRLDLNRYTEEPRTFSGNTYFLEGELSERIVRNATGAVFSVTTVDEETIAVFVPTSRYPAYNLEKGQRLKFDIEISDSGAAVAKSIAKQ